MADIEFVDLDRAFAQSRLETRIENSQDKVNGISRAIRKCQREYDRLYNILSKGEVINGVSSAIGLISSISLIPGEYSDIAETTDLISTPAGKVVMLAAIGGFAVAGVSSLVNRYVSNRMQENQEQQDELFEELEFEESILTSHENVQAINQIKTAIHGEDIVVPEEAKFWQDGDASLTDGIANELPKIVVIDTQRDFPDLPSDDFCQ